MAQSASNYANSPQGRRRIDTAFGTPSDLRENLQREDVRYDQQIAADEAKSKAEIIRQQLPALISQVDVGNPTASLGMLMQSGLPLDAAQKVIAVAQKQAQQESLDKDRQAMQNLFSGGGVGAEGGGLGGLTEQQLMIMSTNPKFAKTAELGMKRLDAARKREAEEAEIDSVTQVKSLQAQQVIDAAESLKSHKGFEGAVGAKNQNYLFGLKDKPFKGTDEAGFEALKDQVQGKVFLQGYEMLKGGGPITDIEGSKAEKALARIDTAQNEDDFIKGVDDFVEAVRAGAEKLGLEVKAPPAKGGTSTPTAAEARAELARRKAASGG